MLLNNQQGGFTLTQTSFASDIAQAILADVNKDGNLDLILSFFGTGDTGIYFGNGQGGFGNPTTLGNPLDLPGFNLVADLNGDGVPDIAVMASDTAVIYLGTGRRGFNEPAFCIGTGPSPGDLPVVNLRGQSRFPDLVAPDSSGGVMILINEGALTSGTKAPYCYPAATP